MSNLLVTYLGMKPALFGFVVLVLGMVVIFIGIAILIGAIQLVRAILTAAGKNKKQTAPAAPQEQSAPAAPTADGVTPETVAAITAAIEAYYEEEQPKTEFVVRRIKKH